MSKKFTILTLNQRVQHFILFSSFILCVLTGFPLRYYEINWAAKLYLIFGGIDNARLIHHSAGIFLTLLFLYHIIYGIYTVQMKETPVSEIPLFLDFGDLPQFFKTIGYLLFWKDKPHFGRFKFTEKFFYHLLFLGIIVMIGTGLTLMFPEKLIIVLPLVSISFIQIWHSEQALWLVVIVLVGHLYRVHFNSRRLFNWAWITGKVSEEELQEEHYLEYERITKEEFIKEGLLGPIEISIEKKRQMSEEMFQQGIDYFNQEEYKLAVKKFRRALKIYPSYAKAQYHLALSYQMMEEFKKAIKEYKTFITIAPEGELMDKAKENVKELMDDLPSF